ncbi:MAG: ABC transporter permease subunit [Enterocloster bolteae]
MNIFLQAAANGIMVGGIYALIGMSLTLIFGVMKIINFCQGELLMLGMYISFVLFDQCGLDPFVAIPIVAVVMSRLWGAFAVNADYPVPARQ